MERSARVLLCIADLGAGGAERQAMHLARGLAERGVDVTLCALGELRVPVASLVDAGVRVLALGAAGPRARAAAIPALARLARRADVVHCVNWDASLYGRLAALSARRPVTVADHSNDRTIHVSRRGAPRGRLIGAHHRLLSRVTAATVVCAPGQEPLLLGEGVPRDRLVCIPNGVPVDELRAAARTGVTRAALGVPDDALVVLHVGFFRPEKHQAQTLETVAELRRRLGDVRAVFAGVGPAEPAVRRRAAELGAGWAHFLGRRTDVPRLLALADLVVLPSLADTMPMTLLEAAAVGVPVVANDVGDVRPVLEATGGGVCVPAGDAAGFTAACADLLAYPEARRAMARRARESAVRFDAARMVDRYAELFGAVRAQRAARDQRLRVAHVGPDIRGRGGMPAVISALLASSLAQRHRLTFIRTYGSATYGDVDPWRRAATFADGMARLVAWSLRPGRRLVHVHAATRGSWYRKALCVVVVRALGRPVILHVHAGAGDIAAFCERIGPLRRRLFGLAFRRADRVISVSRAAAAEMERRLGVRGILVLPTPAPRVAPDDSRTASGNGRSGAVEVLYLGGFANPAKGGRVLLRALPDLLALAPHVHVSLAGLGAEPELVDGDDRVDAVGWLERDAAAAALDAADIVVLPSLSEGLPVALLEALAHGRAVVAARVGGIPEVITDGVDGVLVPPGDPDALARAIAAVAADPQRRARLGAAGRQRAAERGGDEAYDRLDVLYRELAGRA